MGPNFKYCYKDYFDFRHTFTSTGRNLMQLSSEEVQTVRATWADAADDLPGMLAQNLLCFGYGICYDHAPEIPDGGGYRLAKTKGKTSLGELNKVTASPNPAVTFTTFSYTLPLLKDRAVLSIADVTGRVLKEFTITTKQGQLLWDTREMAKGIYIYQVKDGSGTIAKGKVVVEK